MSTLIVEIARIYSVEPCPDSDFLDLIKIKGWSLVVSRATIKNGDLVIYIPPDAILPESLHKFLGITKYLAHLPKGYGLSHEKCSERPGFVPNGRGGTCAI